MAQRLKPAAAVSGTVLWCAIVVLSAVEFHSACRLLVKLAILIGKIERFVFFCIVGGIRIRLQVVVVQLTGARRHRAVWSLALAVVSHPNAIAGDNIDPWPVKPVIDSIAMCA